MDGPPTTRKVVAALGAATVVALAARRLRQRAEAAAAPGGRTPSKGGEGPLHRVDPALAERGRALQPGRAGRLYRPKQTHVIRFVLTGGPCAGKSSSIGGIMDAAKAKGYDVYIGPEVATLLFNCGFSFPTDPSKPGFEEQTYAFQKNLVKLMLQLERSMTAIAASTGRPSIILYDRGMMDCSGYMAEAEWLKLLDELDEGRGVSEDYCLKRYDGVAHLVTAADGAEDFYKWGEVTDDAGKAVYRKETPEEARELDEKMRRCWRNHPRHIIIKNGPRGLQGKVDEAAEAVLKIAQELQPQ